MDEGRRTLLRALTAAGVSGLLGCDRPAPVRLSDSTGGEPPPEGTRIRLNKVATACLSPQYVAAELLRAEGFAEVEYVADHSASIGGLPSAKALADGHLDISMNFAAPLAVAIDRAFPIVLLAGVHSGCFELVATKRIRKVTELKGKTVAVAGKESGPHIFLASIATSVGLDPNRDIEWAFGPVAESKQALADERIDAMLAFPPDAQELRAKGVGHVLLNSAKDRPWSQYFCCLVAANRDFALRQPIATKRALRALLKASEICAADPDRAAKTYLGQGFGTNEQYVRQALSEIPYGVWRDYNPEETVRFYALRLHEAAMVNGTPQKLIAQGTDWRILEQLKKEMKT